MNLISFKTGDGSPDLYSIVIRFLPGFILLWIYEYMNKLNIDIQQSSLFFSLNYKKSDYILVLSTVAVFCGNETFLTLTVTVYGYYTTITQITHIFSIYT